MRYRRKSGSEVKKSNERDKGSRKQAEASGKGISKNNVFNKVPSRDKSSLDRADIITDCRFESMISDGRNGFVVSILKAERPDSFRSVEVGVSVFRNEYFKSVVESIRHGIAVGDPVKGTLKNFGGREASHKISEVRNAIASRCRVSDMSKMVENAVRRRRPDHGEVAFDAVLLEKRLSSIDINDFLRKNKSPSKR